MEVDLTLKILAGGGNLKSTDTNPRADLLVTALEVAFDFLLTCIFLYRPFWSALSICSLAPRSSLPSDLRGFRGASNLVSANTALF